MDEAITAATASAARGGRGRPAGHLRALRGGRPHHADHGSGLAEADLLRRGCREARCCRAERRRLETKAGLLELDRRAAADGDKGAG